MSYLQAFVIALVQGVTELFPVSSLGHSVLIPAWIGGSWQTLVTQSSQASSETSFYLAYIVALHCATALALLWFFRADWARIIRGLLASLLRALRERHLAEIRAAQTSDARIARLSFRDSLYVGLAQITALFAGISRSGVTMAGGLWRGLDHEDAARFAFLLATPPILAAGVLKLPSLAGTAGAHIHGQILLGVVVTAITAYLSVRFLLRYFQTRTLTPCAIYCLALGAASIIRFAICPRVST